MTAQHDIDVEEINLIQTTVEMETKQIVSKIAADKRKAVKIIQADNIRALAELRA